jgi:hypothetical protein
METEHIPRYQRVKIVAKVVKRSVVCDTTSRLLRTRAEIFSLASIECQARFSQIYVDDLIWFFIQPSMLGILSVVYVH